MVTPEVSGTLTWIASEGEYAIEDPIAKVKTDTR